MFERFHRGRAGAGSGRHGPRPGDRARAGAPLGRRRDAARREPGGGVCATLTYNAQSGQSKDGGERHAEPVS